MATRADLTDVITIEDLLIDEDVWGFWDTREDNKGAPGRPYQGVCFLVGNSRIFLVGADTGAK